MARSTSASVVVRPSDSRSAPIATDAVDAHRGEHVRRLHRAARARGRRRCAHIGLVEQVQQRLGLDVGDAHVRRAGDLAHRPARSRPHRRAGAAARRPAGRAARQARAPRPSRSASVAASATAVAAMPAVFCVPLRRSRSCPPPMISGSTFGPPRSIRTPTPLGPPNLWALSDIRSTCGVTSRRSSQHAACTASVCSSASGARRRTIGRHLGDVGDRADLVVDRHDADDRHVGGRSEHLRRAASRSTLPERVDADDHAAAMLDRRRAPHGARRPGTPRRRRAG